MAASPRRRKRAVAWLLALSIGLSGAAGPVTAGGGTRGGQASVASSSQVVLPHGEHSVKGRVLFGSREQQDWTGASFASYQFSGAEAFANEIFDLIEGTDNVTGIAVSSSGVYINLSGFANIFKPDKRIPLRPGHAKSATTSVASLLSARSRTLDQDARNHIRGLATELFCMLSAPADQRTPCN